ncbi:eIF-2-alpha kinase GCN2 isoform X2 [Cimex lectularius]|uniref:non-specific serine/threonine protein kinase n=1 Tax=Cimex lectularius TaxID=79782 RepID=A0A8I6SQF9_CIMLE|nr:eIF-2-alpha kinase GCN2 isoform X2 [Cimex lectularius]
MDANSCRDRQENEKEVIMAIYGGQVIAMSETDSSGIWKPLECSFSLGPLASSRKKTSNDPMVELHIVCSEKYPDEVPEISFKNWRKISNVKITKLLEQLNTLANSLKGEVMIFELVTHVENFLHESIQHRYESFYEEMILRNKEKQEKELKEKEKCEVRKREVVLQQIQSKQQQVKKALRKRSLSKKSNQENDKQESWDEETGFQDDEKIPQKKNNNNEENEEFTPWNISARPGQTRFDHEFEYIKWIGKGAFGNVLKVRNKLDDGYYAIKKIQLNASNKQLNKKILREVKLLSRLNHENVVRYYNSWIEHSSCEMPQEKDEDDDYDDVIEEESQHNDGDRRYCDLKVTIDIFPRIQDVSQEWSIKEDETSSESSESNWIDFRSTSHSKPETCESESVDGSNSLALKPMFFYLYIQMELCERSTLRIAIDNGLYKEEERVWRLLREIVEGLCHIHQQGIIHRDLKPVNIFIGHEDHVKIGDFGLATSSIFQKSGISRENVLPTVQMDKYKGGSVSNLSLSQQTKDVSHTGQVGTTFYVAPELNSPITRTNYNQKVDIFSLGIIFFEMCHAPFNTSMERYKILTDLRQPSIIFPEEFSFDSNSDQYKLIRWMLSHDVKERPNSQELLQSDFIPPPKLEEAEVKEMVRRTLSNPQSKDYKYLVASCFHQVMQPALDATFNMLSWRSGNFTYCLEFTCQKIKGVFQQHGAISFLPPLLTPANNPVPESAVCLMTRLGGLVCATYDLRTPFSRYLIQNPHVSHLKRYAIDKVFREKPAGIHPKEAYECSFDIVTPTPGNLMPELEILSVIWEILSEFPSLLQRNCVLYLNHSLLISTMLSHSSLDEHKDRDKCEQIFKAKAEARNKSDFETQIRSLPISGSSVGTLLNWMAIEGNLNKVEAELELLTDKESIIKCKPALQQLDQIVQSCQILEFSCPIIIKLGLVTNAQNYSGLLFQLVCDQRSRTKRFDNNVIITGGRYDRLLAELRQISPFVEKKSNQSVCGFTLYLDKLVTLLNGQEKITIIDVLICTLGTIQMTMDRIKLIKELWRSGIRTLFVNTLETLDEIHDFCQDQHIPVIVLLKEAEPTFARVRTIVKDKTMALTKDKFPIFYHQLFCAFQTKLGLK